MFLSASARFLLMSCRDFQVFLLPTCHEVVTATFFVGYHLGVIKAL